MPPLDLYSWKLIELCFIFIKTPIVSIIFARAGDLREYLVGEFDAFC